MLNQSSCEYKISYEINGKKIPYLIKEFSDSVEFYSFYKVKEATINLLDLSCSCTLFRISKERCHHCRIASELGIYTESFGLSLLEI